MAENKAPRVPSAEELKARALGEDESLGSQIALALSDITVVSALASLGATVLSLRRQVERLKGETDEISLAILENHAVAETLLTSLAETAHLTLVSIDQIKSRRGAAKYN